MDFKIVISAVASGVRTAVNEAAGAFASFGARARSAIDGINARLRSALSTFAANQIVQAFGLNAIMSYTQRTIEWADSIQDLAERLGVTTRELQVLDVVAKKSGTSVEAISASFRMLTLAQAKAASGKGPEFEAFKRFGISQQAVSSSSPMQLWSRIGAEFDRSGRSAQNVAAAVELLGRNADAVLPAMREDLSALAEEMERTGQIASDSTIKQLALANDQLERVGRTLRVSIAPVLVMLIGTLDSFFEMLKQWVTIVPAQLLKLFGAPALEDARLRSWESYSKRAEERMYDFAGFAETERLESKIGSRKNPLDVGDAEKKRQLEDNRYYWGSMDTTEQERAVRASSAHGGAAAASAADVLQRIGLFTGQSAPQMNIARQTLDQQRRAVTELQRVNRNLEADEL